MQGHKVMTLRPSPISQQIHEKWHKSGPESRATNYLRYLYLALPFLTFHRKKITLRQIWYGVIYSNSGSLEELQKLMKIS